MRSTSLILLIGLIISSCNSLVPREFDFTPVLLHVDKYKQHDSIGFNIATAIPDLHCMPSVLLDELFTQSQANLKGMEVDM